jgi:hypothetical protein
MSKVKDLPLDVDVLKIKVKLPPDVFESAKRGGLDTDEVYYAGYIMGDFFVRKSLDEKTFRVYPLCNDFFNQQQVLEWEVLIP